MPDRADYNAGNVVSLAGRLEARTGIVPPLRGGDGGGISGGMEARVAQLEADMREVKVNTRSISDALIRIEGKLDTKASAAELARIEGKLDSKASGAEVGTLSGKLDDRPTTWKVVTIVIGLGVLLSGSQILKTVADIVHPQIQQTTKTP